jgi:3-dehydrosphinganine reductase
VPSAIITGGSSGIGKAVAKLLATDGWTVTIIARRPAVLESARAEIADAGARAGARVHVLAADVANSGEASAAVARAIDLAGPPDLVLTAAGIAVPGYFDAMPLGIHEQTMAVNYFGTLYTVLSVWPAMRDAGCGSIVMISSGAGLTGIFGYTAYSPSKFAVRGLAESLRPEAKRRGVHVAVVYPPDTDTPQLAAENEIKPAETRAIAAGARVLSADEVARAILRAVRRKRFGISPGLEMTVLERLHSVLSPLLWRWFDRLAEQAHTHGEKSQ